MDWNVSDYKAEFLKIYRASIKREGSEKLLDWLLNKSDFFTAPASTKYHSCFEGGLCEHSVKAYYRFVQNLQNEYEDEAESKITAESVAIIALLHDVCKTNYYKVDYRNVKNENGEWEKHWGSSAIVSVWKTSTDMFSTGYRRYCGNKRNFEYEF